MKYTSTAVRAALLAVLVVGGCAIANKGELTLSRHISIGQELIDLQKAHQSGALTDEEYERVKTKILALVDEIEVVEAVNEYTPDQLTHDDDAHEHHDD